MSSSCVTMPVVYHHDQREHRGVIMHDDTLRQIRELARGLKRLMRDTKVVEESPATKGEGYDIIIATIEDDDRYKASALPAQPPIHPDNHAMREPTFQRPFGPYSPGSGCDAEGEGEVGARMYPGDCVAFVCLSH